MHIYELSLVNIKHEYGNIYSYFFESEENIEYSAGQWIHLGFPNGQKDKSRVHHMSFCSAPHEKYIQFTMDVGSGSWFKKEISNMKIGDKIKAFKISGEFTIKEPREKEVVFLIGGLGITPVRSILLDLHSKNQTNGMSLYHVSRNEFLFKDDLEGINITQCRIHRNGVDELWPEIIQNHQDKTYYVCGSNRFVEGMINRLKNDNIVDIVTEDFN